jgi:hypothetical protein
MYRGAILPAVSEASRKERRSCRHDHSPSAAAHWQLASTLIERLERNDCGDGEEEKKEDVRQ